MSPTLNRKLVLLASVGLSRVKVSETIVVERGHVAYSGVAEDVRSKTRRGCFAMFRSASIRGMYHS